MADLYGISMKKSEILERVGDISQLCDARKIEYTDGRASGVQAVEVTTGSGLVFTVLPSRCLDISRFSFNGIPIAWQSAVGETSPFFYQPEGLEWLHGFFGGLLTTCGMTYSSHPCEDKGEQLGLHGRAANIPAGDVNVSKNWDGDDYRIRISGRVREVGVYCDNLILNRTIETALGSRSIFIRDIIENAGFRESPLMMLYHINPGWPVVSENSRLIAQVAKSTPFDDFARSEPDQWASFLPPQKDYHERVYIHEMTPDKNGMVKLALVNGLKRTILGHSGIEVTELCIGTLIHGHLQADLTPEEGAAAVRKAHELGVNFIDTAKGYKTYPHIRKGIEGFNDVVIASKSPVKSAGQILEDVESCLRELKRDTIDIFHLHLVKSKSDMREREGALDILVRCREKGMIRAIGLSAHGPEGVLSALDYEEIEVVFPILNKKGLGIIGGTHAEMLDAVKKVHEKGVGLYAMKPLGGGHLINDIPDAIKYLRKLELFDSISVGLKTPDEVEIMVGVFEGDTSAIKRALAEGKERAGRKKLIVYEFLCELCGNCVDACAQGAMSLGEEKAEVDEELCILCGYCAAECPKFAIRVI